MTKLDEIVVNIQLVLICVIQGVALLVLAQHIVVALAEPDWYRYIAYCLGGLSILLVFLGQSIVRTISLIRWPIRIEHLFLYFVAGLTQLVAYSNITSLSGWFFWWSAFSIVALGMYVLDLWILRDSRESFRRLSGGEAYLQQVERRHLFEMKYFVPAAFVFNVAMWILALLIPKTFQDPWVYQIPGTIQLLFSAYVLYECSKNFRVRSEMIGKLFTGKAE